METTIPSRPINELVGTQGSAIDPEALAGLRELQEEGEPDILTELVQMFLTDAEPHLAALREAVSQRDAEGVVREAHVLKGSCANFGARPMSAICEQLQSAGRSGDLTDAPVLLAQLELEYERVHAALSAELAKA